uniref:Uncharacterized protein n=1 Tax=Triticum urartu TaxID=4572 RepID=A0A8R7QQA1_TRIUA
MVPATTWSTNACTWRSDDPPAATAVLAAAHHALAFSSIAPASGPATTSSTASRTASLRSGVPMRTPILNSSTRYLASVHWSPHCGNATTGSPAASVSSVEFQPQCVRKHAVDGCASTRSCGLHGTTMPRPATESRYPSGSIALQSGRTTHRKGRPVDASPCAISASSSADSTTTLPSDAYTTERGACASSHPTQSSADLIMSPRTAPSSSSSTSGPTGMSGGGGGEMPGSASTTSGSSS